MAAPSVERRDFEVAIIACSERVEAAQARLSRGESVDVVKLADDARFLVECLRLLAPGVQLPRPADPAQRRLFEELAP